MNIITSPFALAKFKQAETISLRCRSNVKINIYLVKRGNNHFALYEALSTDNIIAVLHIKFKYKKRYHAAE